VCLPPPLTVAALRSRIARLEGALDDILTHGVEGPTKYWMMVPRVEWDQAVERAKIEVSKDHD
jgi:hypothetical protein